MTTMPGRDPKLALDSADSFRSLAGRFVSSIRMHLNYAWQDALADLGGLVASATNLTLAVEIYLKTLYILLGLQVPHTHNLLRLFSGLPREVQEALTHDYDAQECPSPEIACGITLQLSTRPLTSAILIRKNDRTIVLWRFSVATRMRLKPGDICTNAQTNV